jgi:6-phospho-beta-glucosidase
LKIAEDIREVSKSGTMLVNFTNPAGLVTQALSKYAEDIPAVGVCNVPITAKMRILQSLEQATGRKIDPNHAELKTLGLNHLSWHRGFTIDGEDVWSQVMGGFISELKKEDHPEWEPRVIEILHMIPNYYLQYFYHTDK